jgi:hypothetical protein
MSNHADLKRAFELLAWADRGAIRQWPDGDTDGLESRVALLAILLDLIPRPEIGQLENVLAAWNCSFPEGTFASVAELRAVSLATIKAGAETSMGPRPDAFNPITRNRANTRSATTGLFATRPAISDPMQLCLNGLALWQDRLRHGPQWKYLNSVVPGEEPIPIDDVFVELFATFDVPTLAGTDGARRVSRQLLAAQCPVVSVSTMAARTLERCVVLGEPGSGKSTMMHWLARSVAMGRCPDFDDAILVKLSAYSDRLLIKPNLTPVDFFLESLGIDPPSRRPRDWGAVAQCLRQQAKDSHRCLLLLDGWDEVPLNCRERVKTFIQWEQPYFVVVITSRPSGQPHQLGGVARTDFYRIAGLSPRATRELSANLLRAIRHPELTATIVDHIEDSADLQELATNPFLLGLLVRVLVRTLRTNCIPQTSAEVFEQIVAWIEEQYRSLPESVDCQLTWDQIAALQRLSLNKLFEDTRSPYLFKLSELNEHLQGGNADAVRKSRFVNRVHPIYDEYAFLHATFQEYFAAVRASKLKKAQFNKVIEKSFSSASRLIVLEFVAGLCNRRARLLEERAAQWLDSADRFLQVVHRVARVAAAGRWAFDREGSVANRARRELWREITTSDDHASIEAAVESFAMLDPTGLCRLVGQAGNISTWALNCMVSSLPSTILRKERLIDLLPGAWSDYAGVELRQEVTDEELVAMRSKLEDRKATAEDRIEAARFLGAVQDSGSAATLAGLIGDQLAPPELREAAVDGIASIGGRAAVDALVGIVTGEIPSSTGGRRIASAALRNTRGSRKVLDPSGRDRLLRHLATSGDDEQTAYILTALEGHPIRDGGDIIADIVLNRALPESVRNQAARVLATVVDVDEVQRAVASISGETSRDALNILLEVAADRRLSVDLQWIQARIDSCRDRVELHRLLSSFVRLTSQSTGDEWAAATFSLSAMIMKALKRHGKWGQGDRAKALTTVLSTRSDPQDRPAVSDEAFGLAEDCVATFRLSPQEVPEGQVLLAIAVIEYLGNEDSGPKVRSALDTVLDFEVASHRTTDQRNRLATALANCLLRIAPGELLSYPFDCDPVQRALRRAASERGWLVYSDRIVDAEGTPVATGTPSTKPTEVRHGPVELRDLLKHLSDARRKSLESYWVMVGPTGPCQQGESLKVIYSGIRRRVAGEIEDNVSESLLAIYPKKLPTYEAWRMSLKRLKQDFADQPELIDHLRRIGLVRRWSVNRR